MGAALRNICSLFLSGSNDKNGKGLCIDKCFSFHAAVRRMFVCGTNTYISSQEGKQWTSKQILLSDAVSAVVCGAATDVNDACVFEDDWAEEDSGLSHYTPKNDSYGYYIKCAGFEETDSEKEETWKETGESSGEETEDLSGEETETTEVVAYCVNCLSLSCFLNSIAGERVGSYIGLVDCYLV